MSAFVEFVFSAGGLLAVAGICAVWLKVKPHSRRALALLVSAFACYLVASIPAVPAVLDRALAAGFRPFEAGDVPAGRAAIVVLGSGGATLFDWAGQRYATMDAEAAARVLETIRVFRLMPSATVISSGGNSHSTDRRTPTGESMRAALVALGVPQDQLLVETESRNTREEAVVVARMLNDLRIEHVVLVTTGVHLRRALGAFRAAGIDAIPAIARGSQADLTRAERWLPGERGLWYSGRVAHEVLGLVSYAARGWFSR